MLVFSRLFLVAAIAGLATISTSAAEKTASQLLPPSVVAYAEIPQPSRLIDGVLDHPLSKEIEEHPDYQKYLQSPQYQQAQEVVRIVEAKLGVDVRKAATTLSAEGIFFGGDLASQGVVLLVHSADEQLAMRARDTFLELARAEATRQGRPDPIQIERAHDIDVYQLDKVLFALHGRWLIVANKSLLMSAVLNNCADEEAACLANDSQFTEVYQARPATAAAWTYLDFRLLRAAGLLKSAANGKSDNPALELLIGGIIGALPNAPYVTGTLHFEPKRIGLAFSMPANVPAAAKQREFYFGAAGQGAAPPLLKPQQALLSLSTYRDFGSLWRHAPDLFNDQVNAGFAEAEAGLSTFFSGRNFRDDILGNLEPGLQLVVARQEFADVIPALKLPAGAIVVRLKNAQETARIFKVTFQSAIGFLNVVGGMNGVDPLDVNAEKQGELVVVSAEYLPPKDPAVRAAAAPQFNVSPTAVFLGDKFILASSKALALEVVELVRKEATAEQHVNTALNADLTTLHTVLIDNQEPLVAQSMLEKGHDRAAAEKEIKGLIEALRHIKATSLRLLAEEALLSLSWDVELN